ncbi:MAG: FhaA domain-containing protein [Pseudonocardiaceae bacterium]
MNATQFWTITLVVGLLVGVVVAARRLGPLVIAAAGGLRSRVVSTWDTVRDGVTAVRGVNLEAWPDVLVEQAIRKARPVPGGRVLPLRYRIRCGTELYHEASPHADRITSAFVESLRELAQDSGWEWRQPRMDIELDETVHPRNYRVDMIFPGGSPSAPKSSTTLFDPEPEVPTPAPAAPRARRASNWMLRLPDGRRHVVPLDTTVTIGFDARCDVVLNSKYVSKVNTTVTTQGPDLVVRDGNPWNGDRSTNGTLVNGHRVSVFTLKPDVGEVTVVVGGQIAIEIVRRAHEATTADRDRSGS